MTVTLEVLTSILGRFGDVMISVFAIKSKVREFKSSRDDGILRAMQIHSTLHVSQCSYIT
jgi:hypothetical protein